MSNISTENIKKIACNLYNITSSKTFVNEDLTTIMKDCWVEHIPLVIDELNQNPLQYPNTENVINIFMTFLLKTKGYETGLYEWRATHDLTLNWLSKNPKIFFELNNVYYHIHEIFFITDSDVFRKFSLGICQEVEHKEVYLKHIFRLFEEFIETKHWFIDRAVILEKVMVIAEIDTENKVTTVWQLILQILYQTFQKEKEKWEDETYSIEGFVLVNKTKLNKIKTKYFNSDVLAQMEELDEIVIDSIFHHGVEK